jgi:hypothetical protein
VYNVPKSYYVRNLDLYPLRSCYMRVDCWSGEEIERSVGDGERSVGKKMKKGIGLESGEREEKGTEGMRGAFSVFFPFRKW